VDDYGDHFDSLGRRPIAVSERYHPPERAQAYACLPPARCPGREGGKEDDVIVEPSGHVTALGES